MLPILVFHFSKMYGFISRLNKYLYQHFANTSGNCIFIKKKKKQNKTQKKRRGRMLHDNNKYQLNQGNGIK